MGPPSYMRFVVDRNDGMRRIPVISVNLGFYIMRKAHVECFRESGAEELSV
jgi:hypothetical protein